MAILLAGEGRGKGTGPVWVTAPAETAGLIDQLRAEGIVLTHDPDTRAIRSADNAPDAVTAGQNY